MFHNKKVPPQNRPNVWLRRLFSILIGISLASGCAAARGRSDSNDTDAKQQPADEKPQDNFFSGG